MTEPRPPRFYMPELDGLRFVAFLFVFIHHLPFPASWTDSSEVLRRLHAFGWVGVDIFLVLSAYLLTRLTMREYELTGRFDIVCFYARRVIRIWPLYFMALFIGFLAYPLAIEVIDPQAEPSLLASIRDHLIPFALFFGNFSYAVFRSTLGLYKSLWTVSLEEQFYLVFPLLMTLLLPLSGLRKVFCALAIAGLVAILFRIQMQMADVPYPWIWISPLTRLDAFAAGILIAVVEEVRALPSLGGGRRMLGLALFLFLLLSSFPQLGQSDHAVWQLSASVLASGALLVAARRSGLSRVLSLSPLVTLGKLSFGLYVYHRFSIDICRRITGHLDSSDGDPLLWLLAAVLCFCLTMAAAWTSYTFFEAWFLCKKRGLEIIPSRPVQLRGASLSDLDQPLFPVSRHDCNVDARD